jgi:D-psicose/D-tagatose/L-ribulose 3-epimerase
MKYGVNLMLFGDRVDRAMLDGLPIAKEHGFDGVEVPIFDPEKLPVDELRLAAEKAGLRLTASGALPPGARFYGPDKEARRRAEDYVRGLVRTVAALDARVVCGPLYKPVGDMDDSLPLERQREETARAFTDLAPEAETARVRLAFEPLNRFETNFMNTASQGIDFCEKIGNPAAGLLLDAFHMHIEEKDSGDAVRKAAGAGRLFHFHASENDRGVAGTGQVAWRELGEALRQVKYDDWVVLETFNQANEAIRTAVSCWRPFYPSETIFLREGLAFVKRVIHP